MIANLPKHPSECYSRHRTGNPGYRKAYPQWLTRIGTPDAPHDPETPE